MESRESGRPDRRAFLAQALRLSLGVGGASLAGALLSPEVTASANDVLAQWLEYQRKVTFNVKRHPYGARGDGITNDGPSIQAALDDAAAAGGGIVYLPAGTYLLGSVQEQPGVRYFLLNYHSDVAIVGAGRHLTTLKAPSAMPDQTRVLSASSADGLSQVSNAIFRDFAIDGSAGQQSHARSCVGISNVNTRGIAHLRIRVFGVKGTAQDEGTCFDSYDSANNVYRDCDALQIPGTSTGSGFSATNAKRVSYEDCRAAGSTHWQGFTAFRSSQVEYLNCHGYLNAQRGLNCESSVDVTYVNCFAGGKAAGNTGDGIYIYRSQGVKVLDCTSRNNQNGLVNIGSTIRVIRGQFTENTGAGIAFGSEEDSGNSSVEGPPLLAANGFGPIWTAA